MKNHYKLILVVLSFFLLLTFVRTSAAQEPQTIVFNGNAPAQIELKLTNPASFAATPELHWSGPFDVDSVSGVVRVEPNQSVTIKATLISHPALKEGDVYAGFVRAQWGDIDREIPLRITKTAAPFWGGSPLSGFIIFPTFNFDLATILNIILIVIVLVLLFALVRRIRKNNGGN